MCRRLTILLSCLVCLAMLAACVSDPEARKQRLLETGDRYFDQGMFREAALIYRRALQQDMRFGEAYYKLGLAELEQGRISPAIAALTRATELLPDNEDAFSHLADLYMAVMASDPGNRDAYLGEMNRLTERAEEYFEGAEAIQRVRGTIALVQGDYETAVAQYRRAMEQDPEDETSAVGLAQSLQRLGDKEQAEQMARSYLEGHPDSDAMNLFLYRFLYLDSRHDEAQQILEARVQRDPSNVNHRLQLARHHFSDGDAETAMAGLDEFLEMPRVDPSAFERIGDFYVSIRSFDRAIDMYKRGGDALPARRTALGLKSVEVLATQGNYEQAADSVEEILREDSDNDQALALRAALRLRTGAPEALQSAINDFEAILSRMPENVVLRYNLGEVYLASGNRERALVEFQQAIQRRPDYMLPRYGLARLYLMSANYPRAVAEAEEILKISPDDEAARLIRSYAWVEMGEQQQARTSLEGMLRQTPQAPEATYQLARLNMLQGNYREAETLYRELADSSPPDLRGVLGLAETRILDGHAEEGMEILRKSQSEDPDNTWWQLAIGVAATRAGDWATAERELSGVLELSPDDTTALSHLALVYYRTGRVDAAKQNFERAAELNPLDPDAEMYLGIIAEYEGRLEDAIKHYDEVVTLSPDNAVALNNLAFILAESTDQLDRALTLAQRAVSANPNSPDIADTLGWVYIKKNLNDQAIGILGELVAAQPNHVVWRYHLATAYYQKGDYDRAKREVETALTNNPTNEQETDLRRLLARVSS